MRRKVKSLGIKVFSVIYNVLGFVGIKAYCYGFSSIAQAENLNLDYKDGAQTIVVIVTVLFFLTSYLLFRSRKLGYLIPIFLLTFLIAGGFVILVPIFIAHIIFFTNSKIESQFVSK